MLPYPEVLSLTEYTFVQETNTVSNTAVVHKLLFLAQKISSQTLKECFSVVILGWYSFF